MWIVFALCGAYAVFCLVTNPAGPITAPDSFHYLNMTPIVPLGYPFFLQASGARGAIVAQPIIFSAALALAGADRRQRIFRSAGVAAVTGEKEKRKKLISFLLLSSYCAEILGRPWRNMNF